MKYLLTLLLAAAVVAGFGICLIGTKKVEVAKAQTEALRAEAEAKAAQIAQLETARERAQQQKLDLARQADVLAAELRRVREAAAKAATAGPLATPSAEANAGKPAGAGGFGAAMAKMMQDPAMKKLIRDQQRAMMDPLYNPLIKQLGLSPEGAEKFKDMLANNTAKAAEKAGSLFGGSAPGNPAPPPPPPGCRRRPW